LSEVSVAERQMIYTVPHSW